MRTGTESALGDSLINADRGAEQTRARSPWRRRILWICVCGWTVFVGFAIWWLLQGNGGPSVWVFQVGDDQPGLGQRVLSIFRSDLGLQRSYPWILLGPYVALVAWYFPLGRERLRRNLPLNAAACVAFAWACHAIDLRTTVTRPRGMVINPEHLPAPGTPPMQMLRAPGASGEPKRPSPRPPSRRAMLRSTILDLLAYGAVTGLAHSVNFYVRLRERERRALVLESNLANARLNTLKAQLQPHFLFNSLNAIAALLHRDPRLAETTLVALSELLRMALSQSERQEGALREELEFVERYLQIQQTRFGDKLRVEQDIEPQALDCLAPTLVLQPLVENAIRHGIEPGEKAGMVRVSASREDGKLILAVEDDGVGLASAKTNVGFVSGGTGIGLANLRERLQALYGARQKLELAPRPTGGVVVRVEIPWRTRASCETNGPFEV
jgi:two-component sensor histidine kinase